MGLIPATAFPLSATGNNVTGADGSIVRLCGVNWEGAHQDNRVAGGLDKLHRSQIIARIISWGMNHIRFPFSTGMITNKDGTPYTGLVDPARVAANPDLAGLTPWQAYQQIVADVTAAGLYVVVNNHISYPGWCCSNADVNGLWYNDNWPSSVFTNMWIQVATTFAANNLVGYDLRNEPRSALIGGDIVHPSWGDGNSATDFRLLYQNTTGRIRAADPSCLVFCEGLSYASDLTGWLNHPVTGLNIVPSVHDYPWFHPAGQSLTAYYNQMDNAGGYLVTNNTAPLWVGEFGANLDKRASFTTGWMDNFISYANARHLHWCWWSLSSQAVKGTEPGTSTLKVSDGDRQAFGLMAGQDWLGSNNEMIALLQEIM